MNPQSTSSSQLGQTRDQESMRSGLKSCLEYLDRVCDSTDCIHEEIVEIRTCITELLATCQSAITMENEGTTDNGVNFHTRIGR
ncbi:hypothetical protein BDR04DRAFT_800345 [Suillus decipiens]|nr:hypothetical protein BDR04DRAFT_800345 [Suillus decipiens]